MTIYFRRPGLLACSGIALLSMALQATAASTPRAWLVSKGNTQAVLVGESHFGTPTEKDRYFDTVIQPSFAAADIAVMETYSGPDQQGNELVERGTPCLTDPKDRRTDRVSPAFDQLIAATRANGLEVPNWMAAWKVLPEYLFTSNFLDTFTGEVLGRSYVDAVGSQLGWGTSPRLHLSGLGPREKDTRGLESFKVRRTIFCSASAAHRQDFLADHIFKVAALLRLKQSNPSYTGLDRLAAPMGRVVDEHMRCVDQPVPCAVEHISADRKLLQEAGWMFAYSPGTFEISLKQRTRAWVPLIEKVVLEHRKTFIIVGSMHLPDLSIGGKTEPGLISLLRERGFSVKSISTPEDIKSTFLTQSASDHIRSWFR
jgi:hypothetical protein